MSSGKRLLASTLLTKGVSIREDATFLEISNAIANIPTQITVESVPGTVTYDRHYHIDGTGQATGEAYVPASRAGNCFDTPVKHTHSDSCREKREYYEYQTGDSVYVIDRGPDYGDGENWQKYRCPRCNKDFYSTNGSHEERTYNRSEADRLSNGNYVTRIANNLICGMDEGTVVGYGPGCGYVHGQIIGARIDYSGNKNYQTSQTVTGVNSSMMRSTRALDLLSSFDFDGYVNSETRDDTNEYEWADENEVTEEMLLGGRLLEKKSSEGRQVEGELLNSELLGEELKEKPEGEMLEAEDCEDEKSDGEKPEGEESDGDMTDSKTDGEDRDEASLNIEEKEAPNVGKDSELEIGISGEH